MKYSYLDSKTNITVNLEVRRQKNIILHFRPGELFITSPKRLTKVELFCYLRKYEDKILALTKANSEDEDNYLHLWGKRYILKPILSNHIGYKIDEDIIYIFLKSNTLANLKAHIKNMYNEELKKLLPSKLLEAKESLKDNKYFKDKLEVLDDVKVNYYKTFLGRCFIKTKKIEMSSYLAKYDPKYILGVIYHELTHLIVYSHDKYFHYLLDSIYPENRILTKEMKSLNSSIIKDFL